MKFYIELTLYEEGSSTYLTRIRTSKRVIEDLKSADSNTLHKIKVKIITDILEQTRCHELKE